MKLYTERQMREMFRMGFNRSVNEDGALYQLTPIELPSDDEIWDKADEEDEIEKHYVFIRGAKWMRDKIQGGNK